MSGGPNAFISALGSLQISAQMTGSADNLLPQRQTFGFETFERGGDVFGLERHSERCGIIGRF